MRAMRATDNGHYAQMLAEAAAERMARLMHRLLAALLVIAAIAGMLALAAAAGGCTMGQLAPKEIKLSVFAAQADAQVTAAQVRAMPSTQPANLAAQRDAALDALDRIAGTPPKGYQDGLLWGPRCWMKGVRPDANAGP